MELIDTSIPGCRQILLNKFVDHRGDFIKVFNHDNFLEMGIRSEWKEEYFSTSMKHVIRGMHFQTPSQEHDKLVFCLNGEFLDVVVDLRVDSPMFKKFVPFNLTSKNPSLVFIPKGCAHGFLSMKDNSTMFYKVSSVYNAEHDKGILWNSIGFEWPVKKPIISNRDNNHPEMNKFDSPFITL